MGWGLIKAMQSVSPGTGVAANSGFYIQALSAHLWGQSAQDCFSERAQSKDKLLNPRFLAMRTLKKGK